MTRCDVSAPYYAYTFAWPDAWACFRWSRASNGIYRPLIDASADQVYVERTFVTWTFGPRYASPSDKRFEWLAALFGWKGWSRAPRLAGRFSG